MRIAIFWRPDNPGSQLGKQGLEAAARGLGFAVEPKIVTTEEELDTALSGTASNPPDALTVNPGPPDVLRSQEIAAFAMSTGC